MLVDALLGFIRTENRKPMKKTIALLLLGGMAITFNACGSDDENENSTADTNINKNSTETCTEASRLEFPQLKGGNNIVIVHRTGGDVNYSVEWDIDLKSQRWSCYTLDRKTLTSRTSRYYGNPQYPLDPDLPLRFYLDRPTADYSEGDYFYGSGYDHGHICPSADRLYSKEANYQTFFLTNMQPQYNAFNANLWANMEEQVRIWARASTTDTLYVCKGATIDKPEQRLLPIKNKLLVPRYFFMALLLKNAQGFRAMAFWAENENVDRSNDKLSKYAISVDELEKRTGIDFFCNLPDETENQVEKNLVANAWGLR